MKTTKAFYFATMCAKVRELVYRSPRLAEFDLKRSRFCSIWDRSQVLTNPHTQIARGFVFIHVPKAAGTSLRKALGIEAPLDISSHQRARDIMPFIKEIAPSVISIAFVRNPYSRFVSSYNYARLDESLYHSALNPDRAPCGKHRDYDTLSDKTLEECAELLIQGKLGEHGSPAAHWHPQVEWLTDKKGALTVDFIGHIESLNADLQRLQELHGIAVQPIPWLNKSSDDPEKAPPFTERARDLVRLYYKRDFEMLGYSEEISLKSNVTSV